MRSACSEGQEAVLYGWGKDAPAMHLPTGVGFSVGPGTGIQYVVLQVSTLPGSIWSHVSLFMSCESSFAY